LVTVQPTAAQDAFITTWETTSANESITIPTKGGFSVIDYTFEIDWGDGTVETIVGDDPDPVHTYASAGTHTVAITGTFPHFYLDDLFGGDPNSSRLQSVEQWGAIQWKSMESAFAGAENMTLSAPDAPDLTDVTDMSFMFYGATSFNQALSEWDVSNVTDMSYTFAQATNFNQALSAWDVSSVTDMSNMFAGAEAFDQDIGGWNVARVTDMSGMFDGAAAFSQDIGGWDVSEVTDMSSMFWDAEAFNRDIGSWDVSRVTDMGFMFINANGFNQDISGWDVSEVTDMANMFNGAAVFDQDIGGWDVSRVADMSGMFDGAVAFDQDISGWNVSEVTDMSSMFWGADAFDQNIGSWDVSRVTDMGFMFTHADIFDQNISNWDVSEVTDMSNMFNSATAFDQDISGWNVSRVADMSGMFNGATAFNQDIGGWEVSNVTDMSSMFWSADAFDQDIGSWDVARVTDMSYMFYSADAFDQDISGWDVTSVNEFTGFLTSTGLSPDNYGALLTEWESLDLQNDLTFDAGSSQYPLTAVAVREAIITDDNWTINDGGLAPEASTSKTVSSDGLVDFGATGVDINFADVFGSGDVTVERFGNAPSGTQGISETNVSTYRLVITAGCCLSFGSSTEVRFNVEAFGGITDPTAVTVYKRSSEGGGPFAALVTRVDDNGTPGDISDDELIATTESFSEFVLASESNPLPVEMTSFEARLDGEAVQLTWRTASETNNAGFEVQRRRGPLGEEDDAPSEETDTWTNVGYVEGYGTSSRPQQYQFRDVSRPYDAETLTYRLKQIDTNGAFEYSSEVRVTPSVIEQIVLSAPFPNPTKGRSTIRYALPKSAEVQIMVYNVLGQRVVTLVDERKEAGHHEKAFVPQGLPSGTYYVRFTTEEDAQTQKITVVR
jgi:surface protein